MQSPIVTALLVTIGSCALAPSIVAQATTDVIRGRVTDDSAHDIAGAQVAVTRGTDRLTLFAHTQSDGNYELVFQNGTGDYLVHISAPGMDAFRKRVTRIGAESAFVVNARLRSTIATLEALRIEAQAISRLDRDDTFGEALSGAAPLGGFAASVTPSLVGDVTAAAATQPGIRALAGGGISAFGLPGDQSSTTLNGTAFDASFLPRDANAQVRINASVYDVSRGGYSGRVWTYRIAAQGAFRTTPIQGIADGAGGGSGTSALSGDARAKVNAVLSRLGIPAAGTGAPRRTRERKGSVVLQLDRARGQRVSLSSLSYIGGRIVEGIGVGALTSTASATNNHALAAFDEFQRSEYFDDRRGLNETQLGINFTSQSRDGTTSMPAGTVFVESAASDTTRSFIPVTFGGPRGPIGSNRSTSIILRNEMTRMNFTGTHHVKLAAEVGFEHSMLNDESNSHGSFYYSSLDDLAADAPSQFMRTSRSPSLRGQVWRGFVSLGDFWNRSDNFQLMYGVRIETARLTNNAAPVSDGRAAFQANPTGPDERVAISPRLGFRRVFRHSTPRGFASYRKSFGDFENQGPGFVLHGGIGAFRTTPTASLLSNAAVFAGAVPGAQRLLCMGPAVPSPDWRAFAADRSAIPETCNTGSTESNANVSPSAAFVDHDYQAPVSWRGNLSVSTQLPNWRVTVDGTISLNRNQQSTGDLNFSNIVQFRTSDESRPIYASADDIAPSTGAVSPVDARKNTDFSRVLAIGSQGKSTYRALTLRLDPDYDVLRDALFSLAYTLSSSRSRGRVGSTLQRLRRQSRCNQGAMGSCRSIR